MLNEKLDILNWWKVSGLKYSMTQMIARDFLVISILTIALESSFSTSHQILTPPHHSRLRSDTLDVQIL